MKQALSRYLAMLIVISIMWLLPDFAARSQECGQVQTRNLTLTRNKSRVITVEREVSRISIGSSEIANTPEFPADAVQVILMNPRQVFLVGKKLGTTNVILEDKKGCIFAVYDVEVTHDLQNLQGKLRQLMPNENFKVYTSQESLVLSGEVSNPARMDAAMKLAQTVAGKDNPVVNMLQVGGVQQVMLEIKVAEIARDVLKRLGISTTIFSPQSGFGIGAVKGGASFPNANFGGSALNGGIPLLGPGIGNDLLNPVVGPLINLFQPVTPTITDSGLFLYSISKHLLFSMVLDALKNNDLAKLLAEPTLTTLSGQEAQFRSGGEFPIPVSTGLNAVTVQFKEFGVGVNFLPVVLDSKRINLKINVSVSDLAPTQTANVTVPGTNTVFVVPSLTLRSAVSTVELEDGQTIAIAGLINDRVREQASKFPGLGDLPVLGLLFRSEEFRKEQTELVMFVTPRLAQPVPPQQVRLPTEAFVEPSDVEFYLMGRLEGQPGGFHLFDPQTQNSGGLEGSFGHGL